MTAILLLSSVVKPAGGYSIEYDIVGSMEEHRNHRSIGLRPRSSNSTHLAGAFHRSKDFVSITISQEMARLPKDYLAAKMAENQMARSRLVELTHISNSQISRNTCAV